MTSPDRLSPLEAIMWRVGRDSSLRMTVGTLMLLDRAPDRGALLTRLRAAVSAEPRLSLRPEARSPAQGGLTWVAEDRVKVDEHVRTVAIAPTGGLRGVLDLVELLEQHPFHFDQSPWDVTAIEGFDDGRVGLYLRADHVLTDGFGGMALIERLYDNDDGVQRPGGRHEPASPARGAESSADGHRRGMLPIDLIDAARPLAARLEAARAVNPLLTILRGAQRGIEALSSVSRQLVVTDGPRSPLTNGDRQASRFEVLSLPAARRAAIALGGSRNDLLVAGVAAGLGAYHERMGLPCGDLRLAMPAGQHRGPGAGGNWFSITRLDVPTSNTRPAPFFGVMSERLAHARREPALTFSGVLAAAVNYLPTRILVPALYSQVSSVDFVATAVPGFRRPRHIGGAAVEASFPFGPRLGRLLNVVGAGNDGRLDVGLSIDPVAIDHPDVLVACIQEALHALVRSAESATCPRPG